MDFRKEREILSPQEHQLKIRLLESNYPERFIRKLIDTFRNQIVRLDIGDGRIAKLCQVLTDHGCITFDSCEGHGKELPKIFFYPKNSEDLLHLSDIVWRNSFGTNFPWQITVYGHPGASLQISYILEPASQYKINLPEDYEKLMVDLDVLTVFIVNYFAE